MSIICGHKLTFKSILHYAFSKLCVGCEAQHRGNVHATQITLPIEHFAFSSNLMDLVSYLVIMKIIMLSKFHHHGQK